MFNTVQCTPAQRDTVPSANISTTSSLPHPSTPLPTLFLVYCLPTVSVNPLVKPRLALTPSQVHGTSEPNIPLPKPLSRQNLCLGHRIPSLGLRNVLAPLLATAQTAMIWQAPTVTSHGAMNESRDSVCMCPFVPLCVGLAACPQGACVGRCLPLLRMECCGWVPIICPLWAEQGVGAGSGGCGRGPHREAAARTRC